MTTVGASAALSVSRKTIVRWIQTGLLDGVRPGSYRPWWAEPIRGQRAQWRVSLASIERLLASAAGGGAVPPAIQRRLRKMAKPLAPRVPGVQGSPQ